MGAERRDDEAGTAPEGAAPAVRPAYEPPAVAWEEPLEAIAASSCAGVNPLDESCADRPMV